MIHTVTMKDIAAECGVSLSTVSLVLSNSPRISETTRKQVMATCERLGYQPNTHAQSLALRAPSRTICVVLPDLEEVFTDLYIGLILNGIYACAEERGYQVSVLRANSRFLRKREHLKLIKSRRADGLLFVASSLYDQYLLDFDGQDLPVLLVNSIFPDAAIRYVAADHKAAGRMAAEYLAGLGHRHLGVVMGTNIQTQVELLEACGEALAQHGVPADQVIWMDGRFSESGARKAVRQILKENPRTTAILTTSDKMAAGVLAQLHETSVSVPDQVSVMSIDNLPASAHFCPALTTIDLHLRDIGARACERLLAMVNEESATCEELRPVHLVERASTAPPPPSTSDAKPPTPRRKKKA